MKAVKSQLEFLGRHDLECVIIGGVAGALHGSAIPTTDLDVCYSRTSENLARLATALQSVNARLRNAPDLPFLLDAETLHKGLNFTFITDVGDLDFLGEVRGIGYFDMVAEGASSFEVLGYEFKVIALEKLVLAKRTAGRAKDLLAVAELEAILESKTKVGEQ
ncbi:MAG: hypothetical protein ABI698_03545 [bacterium]